MTTHPDLLIQPEWLSAEGVRTPEFAATWCMLRITVGGQVVTRVDDDDAQTTRSSIFCAAYPLAEWIATHWWALRSHVRPSAFVEPRTQRMRATAGDVDLDAHEIRAAGDGFIWPDLVIVPEGTHTMLKWTADGYSRPGATRFVSSGQAWLPLQSVLAGLSAFINATIDRLQEVGISETLLAQEWEAVNSADAEEAEFCDVAAALGLDPYDVTEDVAHGISSIGAVLGSSLGAEFASAADPDRLHEELAWVNRGLRLIAHKPGRPGATLKTLRQLALAEDDDGLPWEIGWRQARTARKALAVDDTEAISLDGMFRHHQIAAPDQPLQAVGSGVSGSIELVTRTRGTQPTQRFVETRALWRDLQVRNGPFLLTTTSTYEQRIERAFAAELLAPASGIAKLIPSRSGTVLASDVERVARQFATSPIVIGHQVENQLGATVIG